jgi:hypothetical protein
VNALTLEPTIISLPSLRVWIRDRVGPLDCKTCGGRRAFVCQSCKGEGACECDMGYDHTCHSCRGTGFSKCETCTPKIEWEQIPRPRVRLCGVDVLAWDLLDALSAMPALVAQARRDGDGLHLQARTLERRVHAPSYWEPRKDQPVYDDYPVGQLVLRFDETKRSQRKPRRSPTTT